MGQDGAVGGDTKTILVIGDASRIAATLVDNLEDAAYRVVFSPPEAALRLAVNHHPLLVLTDLSHEGGASAAAVRALKRDPELADSLVVQMVDERDAAGDLPTLPLGVASLMGGYLFLQFGPDGLLAQIRALLQTRASMIAAHQRQIEETHSAGMARQQTFLDALADLAFAKDAAFRYVMVNKANCSFFGRSQEDILGKTDFDLMPEAQARACRLTDEQALGEGRVVVSTEAVGDRLFETRKFPVPLHSGMGVGGVIRDVTAERSGQDVLQQSEARLRSFVSVLQYPAKTVQELLDSTLNEGIALTESKIGYIYHYDEARSQFILNTWSRDVMPACLQCRGSGDGL